MSASALRVLQITSAADLPEAELMARVARAPGPSFAVQLRDPELPGRALLALAERLRGATRAVGARLLVNDRLDVALAVGADGVHLGRRSVALADARALLGPAALLSVACHDVGEVLAAARAGADLVTLSPVFASPGKGAPLGVAGLVDARAALEREGLPACLFALGGVTAGNASACLAAGAHGVASIRADLRAIQG